MTGSKRKARCPGCLPKKKARPLAEESAQPLAGKRKRQLQADDDESEYSYYSYEEVEEEEKEALLKEVQPKREVKGKETKEETPKEKEQSEEESSDSSGSSGSERFRRSPPRRFSRVFHARGNPWHGAWGALFGGRIEGWQHAPGPAPSPGHPFWSDKGWPSCSCSQ